MRYTIDTTPDGYRLTMPISGGEKLTIEEPGGHGPLEALYAQTERVWNANRQKALRSGTRSTQEVEKDLTDLVNERCAPSRP